MFSGIISDLGRVRAVRREGGLKLVIETSYDSGALPEGASVACSGVCLTVVEKGRGWFAVDVAPETVARTTLRDWRAGTRVNLERALRLGDEIGGHLVTGHVDGVAEVLTVEPEGDSVRLELAAPAALSRLIAEKGSVALDGVSLTVTHANEERFGVMLIPYTRRTTTLGRVREGSRLNLEVDTLARYVARLMEGA